MTKTETAKKLLRREFVEEHKYGFRYEYYTIDGVKDGECKVSHMTGEPRAVRHYKKGHLNGEFQSWYDNGQLHEHSYYKNGKLDGEFKEWRENGKLITHCFYKDGVEI